MNIGIDLGGSHFAIGIVDGGKILCKKERDFDAGERDDICRVIEDKLVEYITTILKENNLNLSQIESIGIAAPGTIKDGVMIKAENLGVYDFELAKILKNRLGFDNIYIQNDAKCAGICEKKYGALRNYEDTVFFVLGTGIGGAVFMDGKLLQSKQYAGFELGHMVIERNGKQCTCGRNGCFEAYASMKALRDSVCNRLNIQNISGEQVHKLVQEHKAELQDILDEFIDNLHIGFTNIINIFEPEAICIGGSFTHYKDILLEPLRKKFEEHCESFDRITPEIVLAEMGNDSGIIGSTILQK